VKKGGKIDRGEEGGQVPMRRQGRWGELEHDVPAGDV